MDNANYTLLVRIRVIDKTGMYGRPRCVESVKIVGTIIRVLASMAFFQLTLDLEQPVRRAWWGSPFSLEAAETILPILLV